jgi:hypothetical protein
MVYDPAPPDGAVHNSVTFPEAAVAVTAVGAPGVVHGGIEQSLPL